jgi:sugar phosphate isomerase/epimerase
MIEGGLKPYPSLIKSYKGMFPFILATTSYIYPDHIIPNVVALAPFLDEIELVLFESEGQDNLLDEMEIQILKDISFRENVGLNVHLPIDLFLGDEDEKVRSKGISIIKKVFERTLPLNPSLYILHFDRRDNDGKEKTDVKTWRSHIRKSAKELVEYGIEPYRISIETLGYPIEWIEDILKEFGFSVCLDIGHILNYGLDLKLYLERYLKEVSIIHLHGLQNGIDHLGIDRLSDSVLKLIFSYLHDYRGILSIEVFSFDDLRKSLTILEEKWGRK